MAELDSFRYGSQIGEMNSSRALLAIFGNSYFGHRSEL